MEPNDSLQSTPTRNYFFRVTTFSKYLALGLFILLPFVSGWIGYQYAPTKVVEVEKSVEVKQSADDEDEGFDDSVMNWLELRNLRENCLYDNITLCDNSLVRTNILGQFQVIVENIHEIYRDFANSDNNSPYIERFHFPNDSNRLFFKSFIPHSSGCCNIIEFYTNSMKFKRLNNGRYDPSMAGYVQSPGGSKIARLSENGLQIEVVDILTDSVKTLVTSGPDESFIYQISLYGGDNVPDLIWRDDRSIIYGVYRVVNEDPLWYETELIEYRVAEI